MNKKSKKFLKKYLNNPSPSGFETTLGSQKLWAKEVEKYCNYVELDNYGNCIASYGNKDSKYKVLLDAHSDEIGFSINHIDDKGNISIIKIGGSDMFICPATRINIWTKDTQNTNKKKKPIKGFFSHPAIHVHKNEFKVSLDGLKISVGANTKQEVLDMGINIGDPITFRDGYYDLSNDNIICGRGLDDKLCGFINTEIIKRLHKEKIKLPFEVFFVNSIQEEIGLRGSRIVANNKKYKANVAFVLDVCHNSDSIHYNATKIGESASGKGPCFTISQPIHNHLLDYCKDVFNKNDIPYQLMSSNGSTGTNADSYYTSNGGTPTNLISLPISNMHSQNELAMTIDVENIINGIIHILKDIKEGQDFGYKL